MDHPNQQFTTHELQISPILNDNGTSICDKNVTENNALSVNNICKNDVVIKPILATTKKKGLLNSIKFVKWERTKKKMKTKSSSNESGLSSGSCQSGAANTCSIFSSRSKSSGASTSSSSSSSSSSTTSSSSSSEDEMYISKTQPPDGGWGWVVVLASFFVNLIADGITFSFGIIFVDLLDYFGEGKAKTAWIGSLFMAMPLLSGPIASFLTDRYGCRKVTIVGSILASIGFIISTLTNSLQLLILTFGIISGFGLSLCYVAAVVIIAYYFDKRRSFATGLSLCGSGIGTFLFAPLTQYLLDEYGWRGTTLIFAGFFLNLSVCGALMRDLPWVYEKAKAKTRKLRKRRLKKSKKNSLVEEYQHHSPPSNSAVNSPSSNILPTVREEFVDNHPEYDQIPDKRLYSSVEELPTFLETDERVPLEVLELTATHKNIYNIFVQKYPCLTMLTSRSFSDSGKLNLNTPTQLGPNINEPEGLTSKEEIRSSQISKVNAICFLNLKRRQQHARRVATNQRNPKKSQDAFLKDVRLHRSSLTHRGAMLNINRYRLRASSCPDIYRNSMIVLPKDQTEWYDVCWDFWYLFIDMLDFSYFRDAGFLCFAISNFLLYAWYDIPYVYLADNILEKGYSQKDSSYLISVIGIVNMFGEILFGWMGDRKWANPGIIYAFSMCFCGLFTGIIPVLTNYASYCIASGAFGFFVSANYSLTSIILVELISLEQFTSAYGLLLLVQGVANLIGPPLAGWIYDITRTYDLSFYLSGIFIALSGVFLFILPSVKRYRRFKSLQTKNTKTANVFKIPTTKSPKFHSVFMSCITGSIKRENDVNFV